MVWEYFDDPQPLSGQAALVRDGLPDSRKPRRIGFLSKKSKQKNKPKKGKGK